MYDDIFNKFSQDDEQERIAWIRLARSNNIGTKTFVRLLDTYGGATNAIDNIIKVAAQFKAKIKIITEKQVHTELKKVDNFGASMLIPIDPNYPKQLLNVADLPLILTVKGNKGILNAQRTVAVVGSRNASLNGIKFAEQISRDLAKQKVTVVSGLAKGIDSAAHKGALVADGYTIAVIATGIDRIYPENNKNLHNDIVEKGIVVTEFPFGTRPLSNHFPMRNRIISGIAEGVLVVEATLKSGSLITTNFATKQNREIFAVPGAPFDHRYEGTNKLIREGATLVESALDIIKVLNKRTPEVKDIEYNYMSRQIERAPSKNEAELLREKMLQLLNYTPVSIEDLLNAMHCSVAQFNQIITELELAGVVEIKFGMINLLK